MAWPSEWLLCGLYTFVPKQITRPSSESLEVEMHMVCVQDSVRLWSSPATTLVLLLLQMGHYVQNTLAPPSALESHLSQPQAQSVMIWIWSRCVWGSSGGVPQMAPLNPGLLKWKDKPSSFLDTPKTRAIRDGAGTTSSKPLHVQITHPEWLCDSHGPQAQGPSLGPMASVSGPHQAVAGIAYWLFSSALSFALWALGSTFWDVFPCW